MPNVTIASTVTGPVWQGEDPPKIRIYITEPFITSDGVPMNPGPSPFFIEEDCELDEDHFVVVPPITLPSTEDSSRPDAQYVAKFFYENGSLGNSDDYKFANFGAGFRVPVDTPTTWEDLALNMGSPSGPVVVADRTVNDLHVLGDADIAGDLDVGGDGNFGGTVTALKVAADLSDSVGLPGNTDGTNYDTLINNNSVDIQCNADAAHPAAFIQRKHGSQIADKVFSDRVEYSLPPRLPRFATGSLPAGSSAWLAYDTDRNRPVYHDGATWKLFASSAVVDVTEKGAAGDDSTDDTAAIQDAIDEVEALGGGIVYLPAGIYRVTGLTVTLPTVQFRGDGWGLTQIRNTSTSATTIDVSAAGGSYRNAGGVYGVTFRPTVTRDLTATEIQAVIGLPNFTIEGCLFEGVGRAIKLGSAAAITSGYWVRNCRYADCWQFLKLVRVIDGFFQSTVGDLARLDDPIGIHLDGGCEGNVFSGLGLVNSTAYLAGPDSASGGGTNLLVEMDEFTGSDAAHNDFEVCYFDSAADGAVFTDGRNQTFDACWFNGTYRHGAFMDSNADGYKFNQCVFWHSGNCGLYALGTRLAVTNCYGVGNGTRTTGSPIKAGFYFVSVGFIFTSSFAFNGWDGGSAQQFGAVIETPCDDFVVAHNILKPNGTSGLVNNAGTSASKIVGGNVT